jgi:hypothetical protein
MKKYLLLAVVALASCSTPPSIPPVQVEYPDGEIKNVHNPVGIDVKPGDTVIVQYYSSSTSLYSNYKIYGRYKGSLPAGSVGNDYLFGYDKAIVIK